MKIKIVATSILLLMLLFLYTTCSDDTINNSEIDNEVQDEIDDDDDDDDSTTPEPKEVFVSTISELNQAMNSASPGDEVVMKNGTWENINIEFEVEGTEELPVTLKAETAGKVIISGNSSLIMRGAHVVVDGLHFKDGYSSKFQHFIQIRSSYSRFTNCAIRNFNRPEGVDVWISVFGFHNRIDNCLFEGKTSESVLIIIWRPTPEPNYHVIENNHFKDIPSLGLGGATAIRIGDGTHALAHSKTTIQNNLFENMQGIGKVINIKSGGNHILNNTFIKASGSITIRQGDDNVIEGNYIFPGLEDRYSGGILVIGANHVIKNNYIQGTRKSGKAAIVLYEGQLNNAPGVGGYYPTKNVLIEGNTLVDNDKNIIIGQYYAEGTDMDVPVENITYKNNAIIGNHSGIPVIDVLDPPVGDILYEGNYFFGGNLAGLENTDGIHIADPMLYRDENGRFHYREESPLKGNIKQPPLTKEQVGPIWTVD